MKKIMFTQIVIALYAVRNTPGASCQTAIAFAKTEIMPADTITDTTVQNDEILSLITTKENMKDISIKGVREFNKKFGNQQNVTWRKDDGGYVAQFMNDSVQTMVGYEDDGSWTYILKRYAEKKMSPDLRRLVKSTFFDYVIMEVTEITLPKSEDNIIYRVLIKMKIVLRY